MLENRITKVRYRNFMSFADEEVELGDLTVLIGPNGAGKSNFVDGLRFLRDAVTIGIDAAISKRGGIRAVRRRTPQGGRPADIAIGVEAVTGDVSFAYDVTIGAVSGGDWQVKRETCLSESWGREWRFTRDGRSVQFEYPPDEEAPGQAVLLDDRLVLPLADETFRPLAQFLDSVGAYAIYPDALRQPQQLLEARRLEDNAQNLASVLRRLRKARGSSAAAQLSESLSDLVPGATNFRVAEPGSYLAVGLARERNGKEMWFDAAQLSDGELRLLGILAALHQRPHLPLVAIEEPELMVHPGAAGRLTDELVDAAHRMQVILTTHSPDLVARMPLESLRVVELTDGGTKVGTVASDQMGAIHDTLFSAGDVIRMEGLRRELKATG